MSAMDHTRPTLTVLVVDSDADTAESLAELLAYYGHLVCVALDGATALRHVEVDMPDVVILELRLPRLDGCEVVRRIRERCADGRKRPLLVAVTGCDAGDSRLCSPGARVDLHLVKPVDPMVLVGVLRRFRQLLTPSLPATELDPPPEEHSSCGSAGSSFLAT